MKILRSKEWWLAKARAERDHDEFVCTDCGSTVYSTPPRDPPPTVCGTCANLNEFVTDPLEREELRRRLMGSNDGRHPD